MISLHQKLTTLLRAAARATPERVAPPSPALEAAVLRAWRCRATATDEAETFILLPIFRHATMAAAGVLIASLAWTLFDQGAGLSGPAALTDYALKIAWTP